MLRDYVQLAMNEEKLSVSALFCAMGKGRHLCLHGQRQRQRFRGQTRISQEELPQNAVSPHTIGDTLTQI